MRNLTKEALNQYIEMGDGSCRLNRGIFTDPDLFELEMKLIWERTWVFLGHESQLAKKGDYFTTTIGRQPIVVSRDMKGKVGGFLNVCTHRGAKLCRLSAGNSKMLVCPYHGWTFGLDGELLAVKDEASGAYPPSFDKKALGLTHVAHVETYRGFIFGNLDPDPVPLVTHLGNIAIWIDLLVDQAMNGWEVLKGTSTYLYHGNWKLQAENGVDGYHAPSVHWNFNATLKNRQESNAAGEKIKAMKLVVGANNDLKGGYYELGYGSSVIWRDWINPEDRFNYVLRDELVQRKGEAWTKWAIGRLRNVLVYPNLLLMDQMSTQLRIIRPISVDKTEVTIFGFAPVGEPAEQRRQRIRAYEDFFNASGMATPDDLAEFNFAQEAFKGTQSPWSELSRGAQRQIKGADEHAKELSINPLSSGRWTEDEGAIIGQYQFWLDKMIEGLEQSSHV